MKQNSLYVLENMEDKEIGKLLIGVLPLKNYVSLQN
jgi:hypothetical protein